MDYRIRFEPRPEMKNFDIRYCVSYNEDTLRYECSYGEKTYGFLITITESRSNW